MFLEFSGIVSEFATCRLSTSKNSLLACVAIRDSPSGCPWSAIQKPHKRRSVGYVQYCTRKSVFSSSRGLGAVSPRVVTLCVWCGAVLMVVSDCVYWRLPLASSTSGYPLRFVRCLPLALHPAVTPCVSSCYIPHESFSDSWRFPLWLPSTLPL